MEHGLKVCRSRWIIMQMEIVEKEIKEPNEQNSGIFVGHNKVLEKEDKNTQKTFFVFCNSRKL